MQQNELEFLRELEQVVQKVHTALSSHRYAFTDSNPTEHSLRAKEMVNGRIIVLLESDAKQSGQIDA